MSNHNEPLLKEAERIREDAEYSFKIHYNAASIWNNIHFCIGIPTAALTAISSIISFRDFPFAAGVLSMVSFAMISLMTFMRPSERAEKHKAAAGQYHSLRNQARIFLEIELPDLENDYTASKKRFYELVERRDQLNSLSLIPSRRAYELAKNDIDEGRANYKVDVKS